MQDILGNLKEKDTKCEECVKGMKEASEQRGVTIRYKGSPREIDRCF